MVLPTAEFEHGDQLKLMPSWVRAHPKCYHAEPEAVKPPEVLLTGGIIVEWDKTKGRLGVAPSMMLLGPRARKFKYNNSKVEPAGMVGGLRFPPSAHAIETGVYSPANNLKSVPHLLQSLIFSIMSRYSCQLPQETPDKRAAKVAGQPSAEKTIRMNSSCLRSVSSCTPSTYFSVDTTSTMGNND
ncbi:hypothetical protein B0H11DRAFT_1923377 [Mycena galericulata]|nr:hypothetical protein B0H11DRAFT_1923377 [Mycena galericulata]